MRSRRMDCSTGRDDHPDGAGRVLLARSRRPVSARGMVWRSQFPGSPSDKNGGVQPRISSGEEPLSRRKLSLTHSIRPRRSAMMIALGADAGRRPGGAGDSDPGGVRKPRSSESRSRRVDDGSRRRRSSAHRIDRERSDDLPLAREGDDHRVAMTGLMGPVAELLGSAGHPNP